MPFKFGIATFIPVMNNAHGKSRIWMNGYMILCKKIKRWQMKVVQVEAFRGLMFKSDRYFYQLQSIKQKHVSNGQYLCRYLFNRHRCMCNSGVVCRVVEENSTLVDYIGKIVNIREVDFQSASIHVLLKVEWYRKSMQWNDCLLFSIVQGRI